MLARPGAAHLGARAAPLSAPPPPIKQRGQTIIWRGRVAFRKRPRPDPRPLVRVAAPPGSVGANKR